MPSKRPIPIGTMTDAIWALRETKRGLEAQVKEVEVAIAAQEEALLKRLEQEGVDKCTGKKASISVGESMQFNIVDWDLFTGFVKKTGYFHLMHRRVAAESVREVFEKNGKVPGLEPFTKKKLNIRTLST